jgi:uncharacterized membrane protein
LVDETEGKSGEQKGNGPGTKGKGKARRNTIAALFVVAVLLIAGAAVFMSVNKGPEAKGTPSAVTAVTNVNMTSVGIPVSSITEKAVWYEYNVSGSMVRFFVVKEANGTIHTAFDECWMCFHTHLGFRQNGSNMIENDCNMSFPISQITKDGCSGMDCHPIFLPSTIVGDQLTFRKSDLAAQRYTFLQVDETAKLTSYNSTCVAIPLSSVSANATWYRYDDGGTLIRFFAVKDGNGTVHTAFDDCTKCFGKHLGYRQEGTSMMENCCNMKFAIKNITAAGCSGMMCHPKFLPSQVIGDQVVISMSDLDSGVGLFN